ncbi:phosphoacetylglucosamine mutase [Salvia divinorum]|uniref:Phosphoacetylglucosamine mutase n=1 Tax=Salvia divinorum TaxID=28513 RepID=A0ABD1GAY6_SALDI
MGTTASDMGIVTTPQLHWMVHAKNKGIEATELNYYYPLENAQGDNTLNVSDKLVVDGADGVGGEKAENLKTRLGYLIIDVRNCGSGVLNGVGADYVQKEKMAPRNFGPADAGMRCANLDGDADRLVVYFYVILSNSNKIDLVDGDKILPLLALFLKEQLCILKDGKTYNFYKSSLGVEQTAYANGASTDYLKQMGLEVVMTPTGVQYLQRKSCRELSSTSKGEVSSSFVTFYAVTNFLLINNFLHSLGLDILLIKNFLLFALRLLAVSRLINQAVGDALSGLFLVEAILKHMGWSIHKWNELYQDLPSRQLKVKVVDRTAVITEKAEMKVVSPAGHTRSY